MFINISSYENDVFQGTLQIQSSRPIFNSHTIHQLIILMTGISLLIIKNSKILLLTKNQFENNLVSVIAFHIYVILGIDADTLS